MKYRCVILKDLPDYPKGTVFYLERDIYNTCNWIRLKGEKSYAHHPVLKAILNYPEWYTKKLHKPCLQKLACPNCGEVKVCLSFTNGTREYSGYFENITYFYKEMLAECPCGTIYSLGKFKTHVLEGNWGS